MRALKLLAAVAIAAGIVATAGSQTAQPGGNAYVPGGAGGGVTQIVAGTGISLSPVGGTGAVTVTNTGSAPAFSSLTTGTCTGCGTFGMGTGTTLTTTGTAVPNFSPTMTAATNQDALLLTTPGVASSGNNYYSPSLHFRGEWWSGSASVPTDWIIYGLPVSATSSFLVFGTSINGGAYNTSASINPNGVIGASGFNPGGGVSVANCTNCYYLAGANNPAVGANGVEVFSYTSTVNSSLKPLASAGTAFTVASGTGACATTSTVVGGVQAGHFTCTGTTGASTVTLALAATTTSWSCVGRDITTPTSVTQTGALSTTAVTLTLTSVTASDVVEFHCLGY
jgi:hypothetical protein